MLNRTAFWTLLAVLTVLSLMPQAYLPPPAFSIWDKAQHAMGFAALTFLGLQTFSSKPLQVAAAMLIYGGLIEVVQALSGWRTGDWLDLLADAIGIAIAWAIWSLMRRLHASTP